MTFEDKNRETEDARVEMALRHFREGVREWSEREYARPRSVATARPAAFWRAISRPVTVWGMAAVLAISGVTVPAVRYHQHEVKLAEEAKQKALEARQKHDEEIRQAALAVDDEDLLNHVDSDIAQATPDAMEPLASLMNEK
jgi:hypothetical protein